MMRELRSSGSAPGAGFGFGFGFDGFARTSASSRPRR